MLVGVTRGEAFCRRLVCVCVCVCNFLPHVCQMNTKKLDYKVYWQ